MDSTPLPEPEPEPETQPIFHQRLSPKSHSSSSSSASKLPIKRKTPFLLTTAPSIVDPDSTSITTVDFDSKPPPFKFHRIWTEPDEIRFLQGLLDSVSDGLSFPRDLPIFYRKFSKTTSHPYSKSQLSEKLRRLRKKFRVISSRLARGLNPSLLSPHDRSLFDLSNKLWSPEFASVSPFSANKTNSNDSNLIGVRVSFSPVLPVDFGPLDLDDGFDDGNIIKTSEAREGKDCGVERSTVAKSVLNVFDECLKEFQMVIARESLRYSGDFKGFESRFREQRVAEMDVLAQRLRLVLENSVNRQSK
ncbi:probable transcription factor At5g28040 [Jatropha curcas]|uniref:probable transcription factor At5g28040 n=1 Tax=Jatropha curcas TaxID=180498 RepID=UPI0005FB888C|nr:probable transcription factor At5g28040 [Jatropha curcas]